MKTQAATTVAAIKNALEPIMDRNGISFEALRDEVEVDIDVTVDADGIAADAGYVKEEAARDDIIAGMQVDLWDLRDGLKSLMAGDLAMASTLLARAFDNWPAAALAAEDVIRGASRPDPRQLSLLAA